MARRATGFWVYADDTPVVIPPPPPTFTAPPVVAFGRYLVRVGRPDGVIIGELRGALLSVAWGTDSYGMATMVVPAQAIIRAPELFQFGNMVRIDFDNGLRPWVGVIDPPREVLFSTVQVEMYEASYMLSWRVTPAQSMATSFEGASGAALISDLVRESGLLFAPSHYAAAGGPPIDITFDNEVVLAAVARVQELDEALHYDVVSDTSFYDGAIRPALRLWRGVRADDSARVVMRCGYNLIDPRILEQGPINNQIIVETKVLQESSGLVGEEPLHGPTFTGNSMVSQGAHALRQLFVAQPDIDTAVTPGAGQQYADAQIAKQAWARRRVGGVSLNMSPGLWREFSTGSRIRLEAYSPQPMMLTATINGLEYEPATGYLSLVLSDAEPVAT